MAANKVHPSLFHPGDSKALDNAAAAVQIWYEHQLARGQAKFEKKSDERPVPDVPDEYLRPETFIGPTAARPDGTTAWGVETKRPGRSQFPRGVGSSLEVVSRDESEWMRDNAYVRGEMLQITTSAMRTLGIICVQRRLATEMRAAGYSLRSIAHAFGVEKAVPAQWCESALTWVAGCLIIKPDFSAGMTLKPRRMLKADLGDW